MINYQFDIYKKAHNFIIAIVYHVTKPSWNRVKIGKSCFIFFRHKGTALVSFLTDGLCSQKTARTEKNESQAYYFGIKVFMNLHFN